MGRFAAALVASLAALLAACGTQTDPQSTGQLCAPPRSDCPSTAQLVRSADGRNLLDIAIENRGPSATATLDVTFSSTGDVIAPETADATDTSTTGGSRFPVAYDLEPNQRISDRFDSTALFSFPELRVELGCSACDSCTEPCDVRAEYVFMAESNECAADDDCATDQFCDVPTGKCVECQFDRQCGRRRECDEAAGRCRPPSDGCGQSTPLVPAPLGVLALTGLVLLGRRRPSSSLAAGVLVATVTIVSPQPTAAETPGSELTVGMGARWVTGPLGTHVKRGVGAELRETLRWKYVGISAWIMTDYFVTDQPSPPLIRELQITGFGIGPRGFVTIGPIEVMAGAGYQHVGLSPNPLIRRTGTQSNFHTFGGTVGVAYRWSRFLVRLEGALYPFLELEGSIGSATLSFGISTR